MVRGNDSLCTSFRRAVGRPLISQEDGSYFRVAQCAWPWTLFNSTAFRQILRLAGKKILRAVKSAQRAGLHRIQLDVGEQRHAVLGRQQSRWPQFCNKRSRRFICVLRTAERQRPRVRHGGTITASSATPPCENLSLRPVSRAATDWDYFRRLPVRVS